MMELVTWLAVIILGPGSIAIFVWFLCDLKQILASRAEEEQAADEIDNSA